MSDKLLAIETSCDETAAAVVDADLRVHASVVHSQVDLHAELGGVVPEAASREHALRIMPVVRRALEDAGSELGDMSAVAVTRGPGLPGCLAVGVTAAKGLALSRDIPVVGVNHLEGHLFSVELGEREVAYPAVVLLVSGGHCMLVHAAERGQYELLGQTRDDSPGEAYDKVARELGLGYPGGPVIDRLAADGEDVYDFPRPLLDDGLDFSFSGLKTAVRRRLDAAGDDVPVADFAASFAAACMDVLIAKLKRAIAERQPRSAVVVGGVAASPILRRRLDAELEGVELILPSMRYATDNAAMIGAAGWWRLEHGGPSALDFAVATRLPLAGTR